jgi:dienelactone hydrolase
MRPFLSRFAFFICTLAVSAGARAEEITLIAADGVKVFGTLSRAEAKSPPLILLFHMAGSNRAEYAPIVPKLTAAGYTVLAIDQRSGGSNFGAKNKTVDTLGRSTSYSDALKDLEAALAWAKPNAVGAPVIVWGSSYSAALVFLLAAGHPKDVAGVLSFSPGEYLGGSSQVQTAAAKVTVPVFITQAKDGGEVSAAKSILTAVAATEKSQFVSKAGGVHGSSSLRDDANKSGAADYWTAVNAFLARFKNQQIR